MLMGILLLLLLIVLAATGAFWLVLKVAIGVALGLILAIVAVSAVVWWRVRKALFGPGPRRRGRGSSSRVTVIRRD
jgi:membrane protein implicated in regulation of membrane protease activity